MNPAPVMCGVCLAATRMPVLVNKPTPLVVGGKTVTVVCELCAAELDLRERKQ